MLNHRETCGISDVREPVCGSGDARKADTAEPDVYDQRAQQHRPQYRAQFAAAARDLASQGLLPADIATALGVSEAAARSLLSGDEYAYRNQPTEAI